VGGKRKVRSNSKNRNVSGPISLYQHLPVKKRVTGYYEGKEEPSRAATKSSAVPPSYRFWRKRKERLCHLPRRDREKGVIGVLKSILPARREGGEPENNG